MNNAEWMIKQGYKFSDLELEDRGNEFKIYLKENCVGKYPQGFTMLEAAMKWLDMEYIEPILDDAEKQYLSAVIKPFRNKIKHIAKHGGNYHNYYYEYITVMYYVDQVLTTYSFGLPIFPEGTMYKGMEANKEYTVEELGL